MTDTPKRRRPVGQPVQDTGPLPLEREYRFEHAQGMPHGLEERKRAKEAKKTRQTLGWACLFALCALVTLSLGLLTFPTLTGAAYHTLPTLAFVNGGIVRLDAERLNAYREDRAWMDHQRVFPGVSVDGVAIGGYTPQQAAAAVNAASPSNGHDFLVTVTVGGSTWSMGSDQVPMTRNTEEIVAQAYAMGRQNTTAIRGSKTPFQERLENARALAANPISLVTDMTYDLEAFRTLAETVAGAVSVAPVNAAVAEFNAATKSFVFTQDQSGLYLDGEALYQQILGELNSGRYTVHLEPVPEEVMAQYTKWDLTNSFGRISSFSTRTTSNANRNTNIRLSAEKINGTMVAPGETFSFNGTVGERTAAGGYRPAAAISGGQTQDEIGGGVCQTSSTLFNAAARANMTIVKRSPHAWPSSYIEPGLDATVNWPGLDFQFRNDTDWPVFLVAEYSSRRITCEVYGMSLGPGVSIELAARKTRTIQPSEEVLYTQNPALAPGTQRETVHKRTGYVYVTDRVTLLNGREINREELCTSTYKAYQKTIEYN